jgi:hypothetical protein
MILFTRALLFALLQLSARPDCHAALLAQEGLVALKYHLANEDGHSRTIAASACANLARNVMAHASIIRAALIPAIAALLDDAVRDSQRAFELAQIQYRVGAVDLRAVEARQLALYSARVSRLRVQSEQLAQRVGLHLALGGSFEAPAAPVASAK